MYSGRTTYEKQKSLFPSPCSLYWYGYWNVENKKKLQKNGPQIWMQSLKSEYVTIVVIILNFFLEKIANLAKYTNYFVENSKKKHKLQN